MKVMVETSARHVHLSQEDLDTLFGKGYRLTNKKDLSQPGQFACDIAGTPGCKLVGPAGEVELKEGVIAAKRHIHLDPAAAEKFSLNDKQVVCVKLESDGRSLTFGDVVVRVSPKFAPAMHIDTDESNAAGLKGTVDGEILA